MLIRAMPDLNKRSWQKKFYPSSSPVAGVGPFVAGVLAELASGVSPSSAPAFLEAIRAAWDHNLHDCAKESYVSVYLAGKE